MVDKNIIIDSADLVVANGPEQLSVDLDFGAAGSRGEVILYGLGKPSSITQFTQIPKVLDWYINLETSDSEYLFLYQYVIQSNVLQWKKIFKLIPNTYSTNATANFSDGVAFVEVRLSGENFPFLGIAGVEHLNAHVDIQSPGEFPLASSFILNPYNIDILTGEYVLLIKISASKLDSAWTKLDATDVTVYITINMV